MKVTDFYTEDELNYAQKHLGISFANFSKKRKNILVTLVHYQEGWINEDKFEEKLTKIIKSK